jgi:hypothetical protein
MNKSNTLGRVELILVHISAEGKNI